MSRTWRTLVIASLAINVVLIPCVAVLLLRETPTQSTVDKANRTATNAQHNATQALQIAVNAQNAAQPAATSAQDLIGVISEQGRVRAQLNALCAWADAPYPAPPAGSQLAKLLHDLDQQACQAP
jgi:hypothetical protein